LNAEAFVLDKKVTKKSRLMILSLQSTVPVLQRNPSRYASELLTNPSPQTVTLIVT
jgi:hypothetical protein